MIIVPSNVGTKTSVLSRLITTISLSNVTDVTATATKIYATVSNTSANTSYVAVYNRGTNAYVKDILTSGGGYWTSGFNDIIANSADTRVYAYHKNDNNLYVYNATTDAFVTNVAGDGSYSTNESRLSINQAGTYIYLNREGNYSSWGVTTWRTSDNTKLGYAEAVPGSEAALTNTTSYNNPICVTPDGSKIFQAYQYNQYMHVYTVTNGQPAITVKNQKNNTYGSRMAMKPDGTEFVVLNKPWGQLIRYSTTATYTSGNATNAPNLGTIGGVNGTNDGAFNPDGTLLYTAGGGYYEIYDSKFTPTTALFSTAITGGSRVAVAPDGLNAYAVGTNTISVFGPA